MSLPRNGQRVPTSAMGTSASKSARVERERGREREAIELTEERAACAHVRHGHQRVQIRARAQRVADARALRKVGGRGGQ